MELENEFAPIRKWAIDKGIAEGGDLKTQTVKLLEEAGELAKAVLTNNTPEIVDAIGDCVVVLSNLALLANREYMAGSLPKNDVVEQQLFENTSQGYFNRAITIESCVNSAYNIIAKRTGKMQDGSFVKDAE